MPTQPTSDVLEALRAAALASGVPLSLLWGVAFVESRFDPTALSPAGAQGLMQLMPSTAELFKVSDPYDASQSARGGAAFLARLAKATNWDVPGMLYAYNWGPTNYARAKNEGRAIPASVQKYAREVLASVSPECWA
jgi:soluble lytic murein transglycosylase-like protein